MSRTRRASIAHALQRGGHRHCSGRKPAWRQTARGRRYEAATAADPPALERAAVALTIAVNRLSKAIAAADRPVAELEALVRRR